MKIERKKSMYCTNCGKQIPDNAKFCSHCGTRMELGHPQYAPRQQPAPQWSAPAAPVQQPAPPAQPIPTKKKGGFGRRLLSIAVAVAVYFCVRYATEAALTPRTKAPETTTPENSGVIQINPDVLPSLTDSCIYGALYQDGYVTYGLARVYMPGYFLLPGEGDERDWLMSEDGTCLFSASKQLELMEISYANSTEESIMQSFTQEDAAVTMVDFQKTNVGGFPVVRYIVHYVTADMDQYAGELIVFPGETARETLRMSIFQLAEAGYEEINQVFDTLHIFADHALSAEDTGVIGLNRITVK